MLVRFFCLFGLFLFGKTAISQELNNNISTSHLFENFQKDIFQIQTINQETGQKTSIGSGFSVGDGSILATNYHVISDVLNKKNHKLRYVDFQEKTGDLTLLSIDVINDLALVKADKKIGEPFALSPPPAQGAPLFALGNPHDLGFVINEGTNNGILKHSARRVLLFSGALNQGMSGGPTIDSTGKVVGINVAYLRNSNNISFVVPSEYLTNLLKNLNQENNFNQKIAEQLFTSNQEYFEQSIHNKWQDGQIGKIHFPLAMSSDVRCWDDSDSESFDSLIGIDSIVCFNDRDIFISNNLSLGRVSYSYSRIFTKEKIPTARFYANYSKYYNLLFDRRSYRDYENISCQSNFINLAGKKFKATLCEQKSKFSANNDSIQDLRFIAAQIGEKDYGLVIKLELNGVQKSLSRKVLHHLLEQIYEKNN